MSSPIAISLQGISKVYRVWESPEARVAAALWRVIGKDERAKGNYRDIHALSDVSVEVRKGEGLGIIGLNGSGKSTLLQIIAGTLRPSSGSVRINGRVAALLELGAGFNPDYTGRENVYLNAAVLGLSRKETDSCFDEIAAFADIGDFIEQPVKTYSSGMYVRLAFAVLTQVKPDILIIDEALSVGDFIFQQKCFDVMRRFRKNGVTFIVVSHGMGMILELCDRAVVLDRGKQLFDGPAPKAVAVYEENAVRARYGGQSLAPAPDHQGLGTERNGGAQSALFDRYSITPNVNQDELLAEPGSIHTGKAELIFARFLDELRAEKLLFRTGDEVIISIGFRINLALAEPHIGFKVRDKVGRVIFETSSLCMRVFPSAVRAGELFVGNFRFRIPLSPGEYSLVVGFAEGAIGDRDYREALFYVQHVKVFSVVQHPQDILWSGISHLNPSFGWSVLQEKSGA